jgi:hypothetical protein
MAASACSGKGNIELQYDCIGVGAGVKAESNRLYDEGDMPHGINFIPLEFLLEVGCDNSFCKVLSEGSFE